jgi:hypothetical protein
MQICRLLLVIRRFHVILKLNAPKDRVNQGLKSCPGRKIKHLACDKIFSQQKSTQKELTKSNKMLRSSANIIVLFPVPCSLFPVPCSLFPVPRSGVPRSLLPPLAPCHPLLGGVRGRLCLLPSPQRYGIMGKFSRFELHVTP